MGLFISRKEQMILILALCLYGISKYYLGKILEIPFMQWYFNVIMGGIIFGVVICTANRFLAKTRNYSCSIYILFFLIAGVYWEFVAPIYINTSVSDITDIVVYLTGGICLLLLLKIRGGKRMKCKRCGLELENTAKFCPQCGEKIKLYCKECGKEILADAKFCPFCGKAVVESVNKVETNVGDKSYQEETKVLNKQKSEDPKILIPKVDLKQQVEGTKPFIPRTKESFSKELENLGNTDEKSKGVLNYYGTKFFIKNLYNCLEEGEKVVALRHIVHENYATIFIRFGWAYVNEFLAITNKRVIKFVKSYWLRPRIISCYLSEIVSIEAAKPGNFFKSIFIGERLRIYTSQKTIKIRSSGKGTAQQIKSEILGLIPENGETNIKQDIWAVDRMSSKEESGDGMGKLLIIGGSIFISMVVIYLFLVLGRDSGIEVSECLSLPNSDVIEWITKNGLEMKEKDILYTKDGISVMLDDDLSIYTLIMDQPGYSLYGLEVGKQYSAETNKRDLEKSGYSFLERVEAGVCYEAIKSDGMILLELNDNEVISRITYFKESTQSILGELDETGQNDSEGINQEVKNEETGTYIPGMYEGTWWDLNSQRCYMEITEASNMLYITVHWSSGAFDDTEWAMTGTYDNISGKVWFNNCTLKYIHYNNDGSSTEDVQYTNGTGAIYIADDGYLYWEDDKEHAGNDCYFEKETDSMGTGTTTFDAMPVISSWVGTYIAEDEQTITISSSNDTGVVLTFVGYSEEGWYTKTEVLSYTNTEKNQVSDPYYYDGSLVQEKVYTLTGEGIQVETLPGGGWADGFYSRQ